METKRIGKFTITGKEAHLERFCERYHDEWELEQLLEKIESLRMDNGEPTGEASTQVYDGKERHSWLIHQRRSGSRTWEIKQVG